MHTYKTTLVVVLLASCRNFSNKQKDEDRIDKDGNKTWTYGPKNYPSDRDTVIDNQKGQR